jgi:YggT family protein
MLVAIFWLVSELIHLMILAIIAAAVMSMLIAFGVVDGRNRIVYSISDFLTRVTDPILAPIRRFLPIFGNVDLSPLVAILLLEAIQIALATYSPYFAPPIRGGMGF